MQMLGKNLFPLELLSNYAYQGYYMDAQGEIFSTKKGGLVQLNGSRTSSGRYFTLNDLSHRHDFLKRSAMAHAKFKAETEQKYSDPLSFVATASIDVPLLGKANRSHATSLDQGIKQRGHMIASVQGDKLLFASKPTIHLTAESVKAEMERLAREVPGTKFVSVRVTGSVVAGGVTWE